ncbi:MAG: hypothetical protein V4733_10560 [Verrucomicrobiota bacterium]
MKTLWNKHRAWWVTALLIVCSVSGLIIHKLLEPEPPVIRFIGFREPPQGKQAVFWVTNPSTHSYTYTEYQTDTVWQPVVAHKSRKNGKWQTHHAVVGCGLTPSKATDFKPNASFEIVFEVPYDPLTIDRVAIGIGFESLKSDRCGKT